MTEFTSVPTRRRVDSDGEISLIELLTPLIRHWRLVVFTPLVLGVLAAGALLLMRPVYAARTSFVPESPKGGPLSASLSGLVGLAGQLGLVSGSGSAFSPEFLAQLLQSREVLRSTVLDSFPDPRQPDRAKRPLLEILPVEARSEAERIERGIRRLRRSITATVENRTGIVVLTVKSPYPTLSADVANGLVRTLNEFNIERRQSQSREQRRFTEQRLAEIRRELRNAEAAQLRFLQANRRYRESPLLAYEAERLARDVQLKQDVFVTLSKAYEEARIAEVQDTPLLTIIDRASPPTERASPRRTIGVLIALFVGLVIGGIAAYVAHALSAARRSLRSDRLGLADAVTEPEQDVRSLATR